MMNMELHQILNITGGQFFYRHKLYGKSGKDRGARMGIRKKTAALAAGMILLLTGCAGKEQAPKVEVDISPVVTTKEDTAGNENLKIGSLVMSNSGEWYTEAIKGMEAAASDLGVKLLEQNSSGILGVEEKQIQSFVMSGVDAIVCCPISSTETGRALYEAEKAGVPAITWSTTVDIPITAQVRVDATALGEGSGDFLVEYIRTWNLSGQKIGMISTETNNVGVECCAAFRKAVEDLEYDGSAMIVGEVLTESAENEKAAVDRMFVQHSDLDIIWCWNQAALQACIDYVKESGNKDLLIVGTEMSVGLAKAMLEDEVNLLAVTTQLPYNMGYKAVVNAVRAAKGELVETSIIVPVFTYEKDDPDGLAQYIESHEAFTKK